MDTWLFNRIVSMTLWIVFIVLISLIFMFFTYFIQKAVEIFKNDDIKGKGDKNDEQKRN